MILVEGLQVLADGVLVVKALRHQDSHRLWQTQSAQHQELEYVIEAGRVAHTLLHNGAQVLDIAQGLTIQYALTGFHPTTVTTNGIYFSVVGQQTERLCQLPLGKGVGREARVYQRQSTCKVIVR